MFRRSQLTKITNRCRETGRASGRGCSPTCHHRFVTFGNPLQIIRVAALICQRHTRSGSCVMDAKRSQLPRSECHSSAFSASVGSTQEGSSFGCFGFVASHTSGSSYLRAAAQILTASLDLLFSCPDEDLCKASCFQRHQAVVPTFQDVFLQ